MKMYFQSCPVKYALRVSKINYILMLQNQVGLSPSKWPIDSVDWPELRCRELVRSSGLRVSESPDLRVSESPSLQISGSPSCVDSVA